MAMFDVLLPVRNGIQYLGEAIDSIVAQSFQDWRLFVLDHGSTDGSFELAGRYSEVDSRVVVRRFPEAQGLAGLLNLGLDMCDSRYVLRQDADDISLPNRMDVLFRSLEEDKSLVLVGSLGDIVDASGVRKIGILDMPVGRQGVVASTPFRNAVSHPTVAMRLEAIHRRGARYGVDFIGAIPERERMRVPALAEDYFLFGQLALVSPCMNIDRYLVKYRSHGANVSVSRYLDQMQVALDISRYLARCLALLGGTSPFDPAPFCNHGLNLFAFEGRTDFSDEYRVMHASMKKALPPSPELDRELAYRKTLSVRTVPLMPARYAAFAMRHGARLAEWRTVRSWMIRKVKKQAILRLTPSGLTA